MNKYIALLRGINVGGNNKIDMTQLKECFVNYGFSSVSTYINSGNVIFSSEEQDIIKLIKICEALITENFKLKISVAVILANQLTAAIKNCPDWWNADNESKHNAIFVITPATASEIVAHIGETKPELEKVCVYGNIIFWSAPLKTFNITRLSNIVKSKYFSCITIRNANTTIKLEQLAGN